MRDLTKYPKEFIGVDNIKFVGTQRSRGFHMIFWGRLKLSIDRLQKNGCYEAGVILEDDREAYVISANRTNPCTKESQRDALAEELVFYACDAAVKYKASEDW